MQAPGRALRTWMNAAESGYDGYKSFNADLILDQYFSPPATTTSPVHASRVMISPQVRDRRRLLAATLAEGGRCLQCSSDPMCEDNSRFHSNCVWVDRPCAAQAPVLLACTADRPVREIRANFENIVRVAALPPRRVAGRLRSPVGNWQLFRAQIPAWR